MARNESMAQARDEYLTNLVEEMRSASIAVTPKSLWRWQPVRWCSEKTVEQWLAEQNNETVGDAVVEASVKAGRRALMALEEATLSGEQQSKLSAENLQAHRAKVQQAVDAIEALREDLSTYCAKIDIALNLQKFLS